MAKKTAVAVAEPAPVFAAPAPAKVVAPPKPKFGHDMIIDVKSLPAENPRHEGTKAHGMWEAMVAYMRANPGATVADVIENTIYKRNGFEWDFDRGAFKVKQGSGYIITGNPVVAKPRPVKAEVVAPLPPAPVPAAPAKGRKKAAPVAAAAA